MLQLLVYYNTVLDKSYVVFTKAPRSFSHKILSLLRHYDHPCLCLQRDFEKYGEKSFKFTNIIPATSTFYQRYWAPKFRLRREKFYLASNIKLSSQIFRGVPCKVWAGRTNFSIYSPEKVAAYFASILEDPPGIMLRDLKYRSLCDTRKCVEISHMPVLRKNRAEI